MNNGPEINAYRTFDLVAYAHVYIDFAAEGWPPVWVPASEAPSQELHPSRSLRIRLRDNGGSERPSSIEMRKFTDGMPGAKIIERGTDRVWLVSGGLGWNTKPYEGLWPPPDNLPDSPPVSDEFMVSVLPWRNDCDHVLHECRDGCGGKLVVWRDAAGIEHRKHEGFETPAHEPDKWHAVAGGYLHEWCRTGWRKVCDARQRWRRSIGQTDEAERLAELSQAEIEYERMSRS